jgi:hypothetical protein
MNRIFFQPNVPITLSLEDPEGTFEFEGGQGMYPTTDGRTLILPRPAVVLLNGLDLKPGEEIGICKRVSGKRGQLPTWDIWLTPRTEKSRAAQEQARNEAQKPQDLAPALRRSIDRAQARKANLKPTLVKKRRVAKQSDPSQQPRLFDRGTGTDGPLPVPVRALVPKGTPYPDMLRHIIRTVAAVLKESGEQWNDAAKQDLCSTVYIDAAKRSGVAYDFREGK